MIPRVLEPEVMDTEADARDYDAMDHSAVNRAFAADFLARFPDASGDVLDVGTGTAQIPVAICAMAADARVVAVDLSEEMLKLARRNVETAGFAGRIELRTANASALPFPASSFAAVVSNSIVHHIPEPGGCLAEMARLARPGGAVFVRDLLRPDTEDEVARLVDLHAAGANDHQRMLFRDSLRAALTLEEVRGLVAPLGFPADTVTQTSDRHWTWAARAG